MQGVSYLPGNFYRMDHIGNANGSLLQLVNNGGICNNSRMYNLSQPELSGLDQYLAFNKDLVRQTMLKQEAVFRAQVHELHRLYTRQREMMDEIRGKEQSVDHIRKQSSQTCYFPSRMMSDMSKNTAQMPRWLLVNPKESMTSVLVPGEKRLTSALERSLYRDSHIFLEQNCLREEDRGSSSKRRYCGKTILDLELPAEAYIDDDDDDEQVLMEQNPSEIPRNFLDSCNKTNLGQNLIKESSCNGNYLLDLNESPQVGESETAKCNGYVESRCSITGLVQKGLFGKFGSISSCTFPDEQKSETSNSVLEEKTLLHNNTLETSAVIQILPCFNIPESLSASPEFYCGLKRKIEPEGPSSMGSATTGVDENENHENVTEHRSNKRCIEEPNASKSLNEMDLNATPSNCLIETVISEEYMLEDHIGKLSKFNTQPDNGIELNECPNFSVKSIYRQLSALASSSIHLKSSENEGVLKFKKPVVSCRSHSSEQSETNSKNDSNSNTANEEHAKTKISGDDMEHSPLIENPEDNANEILFQLSEQKIGNPDEDIEKISAETIIWISKSKPQEFVKGSMICKPGEKTPPSDSLDWFADIICSAAASPLEIRLEKISRKYLTLKCTKDKIDDQLSAIKPRKNKRTRSSMLVQQTTTRRSKNQKHMKQLKSDSLSSCDMNNTCGRNLNKKSRVKNSQKTKKICSGSDHSPDMNEACGLLSYMCQWGKKNRRKNGRRAQADNLSR